MFIVQCDTTQPVLIENKSDFYNSFKIYILVSEMI